MIGGIDLEHLEVARLFLFGDIKYLHLLLVLMGLDIITGWAKAGKNKNIWSRKSLFGFARKMVVLSVIILANVVDQILGLNGVVAGGALIYYIANEGLSIIENAAIIGIPVPKAIKDRLYMMKDEQEGFKSEFKEEMLGTKVEERLEDVRKEVERADGNEYKKINRK